VYTVELEYYITTDALPVVQSTMSRQRRNAIYMTDGRKSDNTDQSIGA